MIAAYFHLFLHAVGGPLDRRPRHLSFAKWARILLRRRDSRFRKSRTFVLCLAAILFRREAISNSYWKLTGRVSRGVARTLAGITGDDLREAAREMESGSSAIAALATRPAARKLIKTMQSEKQSCKLDHFQQESSTTQGDLDADVSSTILVVRDVSCRWLTVNPNDKTSPIVMKLEGVDLDVCSRLNGDLPSHVERLQRIADYPVASADFLHVTIDAVMTALLRYDAKDSDGGVLGRIKAFVGE
ncbi:unnamed protein product [Sphacelaria rigidula]